MFTKPSWLRSPSLHDAAAVIVIVRDSTHLQAISLLTLAMKTETLGFHKFYCWFATDIMAAMLGDKNKAISSVKFFFYCLVPLHGRLVTRLQAKNGWFSSVSPISIGMGLHCTALQAGEARL